LAYFSRIRIRLTDAVPRKNREYVSAWNWWRKPTRQPRSNLLFSFDQIQKKFHSIPFDLPHELIDFVHGAAILILAVRVSNLPASTTRLTFSFYTTVVLTASISRAFSCISDPAAAARRPPQQRKPPLLMLLPLIYAPVLPLSTCFALESPPSCFRCSNAC
jgi:hypothetical protein